MQVKGRYHFSPLPNWQRSIYPYSDKEVVREYSCSLLVGIYKLAKIIVEGNLVKFTKALCILLLALKSRPLNHTSSCDWYIENSLKTKSISGNCLQTLTDQSDCCFALSNFDWPLNPSPKHQLRSQGLWDCQARLFRLLWFSDCI